MGRSDEYRQFAAGCLDIARKTTDPATKGALLQMARVWSRLADDIESQRRERSDDGSDDERSASREDQDQRS